ncbi:hypothetical protein [Mesorhizobium sp. ISC25]|uniref:hypothetical protein n=1 Tax=Mesorhizobium sp. ISC25 TaxID=3077335 RepID=UPI0035DA010C
MTGTNTDGTGFIARLAANGVVVARRRALVIGAGGVARAIAFSLADACLDDLILGNRSADRAVALAADIKPPFGPAKRMSARLEPQTSQPRSECRKVILCRSTLQLSSQPQPSRK